MASGDVALRYPSASDATITLASLASDTNLLTGVESDAIDNTTNRYEDFLVSGKITTGTSPTTARTIEVWCIPSWDGTTWPNVFDGTASAETITNAEIKVALCRALVASIGTNATSNVTYEFAGVSIAALFGGVVPPKFVFFVTHSTAVNLNSTADNHKIRLQPIFRNVSP